MKRHFRLSIATFRSVVANGIAHPGLLMAIINGGNSGTAIPQPFSVVAGPTAGCVGEPAESVPGCERRDRKQSLLACDLVQ